MVAVDDLEVVVGSRDAVDWAKVQLTVTDEREAWYGELVEDTAYHKLIDFRSRHLKKIRVCGRSKRWCDTEITAQMRNVRREGRRVNGVGYCNVLRSEISRMKRMVKDKKDKWWRSFCEDSGLQSPWEVVGWERNPSRERERMGRLKNARGR